MIVSKKEKKLSGLVCHFSKLLSENKSKQKDKFLYLTIDKKSWNMKVKLVSIVIGAFGTVPNG